MKLNPLIFVVAMCTGYTAQAQTFQDTNSALRDFDNLVGDWQCQAKQMNIGLEQFELEYTDAILQISVRRDTQDSSITSNMQATSPDSVPLFSVQSVIHFDPQNDRFVQYENTQDGAEATLYSPGFSGPCITWHYAPDAELADLAADGAMRIEAQYCLSERDDGLNIQYTLHFVDHNPLALLAAQCTRLAQSDGA